jgi:outer membrane receptor for ferrienterochelin and colicins
MLAPGALYVLASSPTHAEPIEQEAEAPEAAPADASIGPDDVVPVEDENEHEPLADEELSEPTEDAEVYGVGEAIALPPSAALTSFEPALPIAGRVPAPEEELSAAPDRSGIRTYTQDDFARFAPRTALDMLRQVPGFVIRQEEQERGLGQATGNVLLNGQRLSGKSDDVLAQLSRIPAQNVERIEIVDAASLDIPGLSGRVANVVSRARAITGQYGWRGEARLEHTSPLFSHFNVSMSGERGPVEFTLGVENNAFRGGAGGPTYIESVDGELLEHREEVVTADGEQPRVSGRFVIDGPGDSVANLNLSGRAYWYDSREEGHRNGPSTPARDRYVTGRERTYAYEAGGDYEFGLGPGRVKMIGLHRGMHAPYETELITEYENGDPDEGNRFSRVGDERESIGRAEYRWRRGKADYQLSAEGAFNVLDSESQLFVLAPEGDFEEIPLPGGTARVAEDRYEVLASHGRPLGDKLSVRLAAGGEYSRLRQEGGGGTSRGFWRPKGTASAAYKATDDLDLNLRVRRRVGQLNFFDFLASVNLGDDQANAGNPDLVPPRSWEAELESARRIGAWGTTTVRLFGHVIDDIIDTIPIGDSGESPGNAGRALRYGGELKGTLNFDPIGWRGAKLDALFILQDSRLEDPLTGETRRISNSIRRRTVWFLRHDLGSTPWAWAAEYAYTYATPNYRLTEVGRLHEGPHWFNVFLEHKDVFGLTVQAIAANLLGAENLWDRTVYEGRRTGQIAYVERRRRSIGPIFVLRASGKF